MKSKKEKILITGGAGFIGSHLADALARKGYKIIILDNLSRPVHQRRVWPNYILNKNYQLIKGDVRKKKDWKKALKGISYIFHLAAYQDQRPDFHKFFDVNTNSTAFLYELIASEKLPIKKVILASTQFVYGDGLYQDIKTKKFFLAKLRKQRSFDNKQWDIRSPQDNPATFIPFKESQKINPTNAYGLSKIAAENLSMKFGETYNIPTTILRYSIVQGSRQSPYNLYSGALRIFITQALSKNPITVYEDGKQLRDFVNIKDVTEANILALENKKANFEIFNIGGDKSYRILDFARLVKKITGSNSLIKIGDYRSTDTRHAVSDTSKAERLLNWKPQKKIEDSIKEYLIWYKNNF
jgi:dTDP-L-rhamnose 4-epimerase